MSILEMSKNLKIVKKKVGMMKIMKRHTIIKTIVTELKR